MDLLISSVTIDFPSNSKGYVLSPHRAYDYSHAEFIYIYIYIYIYIGHHKYQVKPHPSPWFSAACAAAIAHKNLFFLCTDRINLKNLNSESKVP